MANEKTPTATEAPANPYAQQPQAEKPKGKQIRTRKLIKVEFNDHEIAKFSREQQRSFRSIADLEKQLESVKADFKAQMKRAEQDVDDLSRRISDGYEMREVDVLVVHHDPEVGRKTTYRTDVDPPVAVAEEAMTFAERQEKLFDDAPAGEDSEESTDSEQETTQTEDASETAEEQEPEGENEGEGEEAEETAEEGTDEPDDSGEESHPDIDAGEPEVMGKVEVSKPSYGATVRCLQVGNTLIGEINARVSDQTFDPVSFEAPDGSDPKGVMYHALELLVATCRKYVGGLDAKDKVGTRGGAALASWAINTQKEL